MTTFCGAAREVDWLERRIGKTMAFPGTTAPDGRTVFSVGLWVSSCTCTIITVISRFHFHLHV